MFERAASGAKADRKLCVHGNAVSARKTIGQPRKESAPPPKRRLKNRWRAIIFPKANAPRQRRGLFLSMDDVPILKTSNPISTLERVHHQPPSCFNPKRCTFD